MERSNAIGRNDASVSEQLPTNVGQNKYTLEKYSHGEEI